MRRKVAAQVICRLPGEVFPRPDGEHSDPLLQQCQGDEEQGPGRKGSRFLARRGAVDDPAHDLRIEELEPDAGEQQRGGENKKTLPPSKQGGEELPVASQRYPQTLTPRLLHRWYSLPRPPV
jgi:hypothetical protein